jgi:hypothetical protein
MSRRLVIIAVLAAPAVVHAQAPTEPATTEPTTTEPAKLPASFPSGMSIVGPSALNKSAPADMGEQGMAATLGLAIGGRTTPGGLRVAGHYFYQLSDSDWFDGSAAFVFGGGDAACFRDRMNATLCEHGLADGYAGSLSVAARRFLPGLSSESFWPFVRAGVGTSIARFSDDETTGITFFLFGGVGLRASVGEGIAVIALANLELGLGQFSNGVGGEPQAGVNISAGAEFKL